MRYEVDLKGEYRAEIDSLGFMPYDSFYENLVTSLAGGNLTNIRLYKEDGYAVFVGHGCRLIWLARAIREVQLFQRDVTNQLKDSTKYLMLDITDPPSKQEQQQKNVERKPGFRMKIRLEDSCVVIPRSSKSKDVIVAVAKMIELKRGTRNQTTNHIYSLFRWPV